jgi:O-antigen ligase
MARRSLLAVFALLPGALVVYLAFNAGGYFPNTQGLVTIVLLLALAGWIGFADEPFAGLGPLFALAAGALAAYAVWTLLSGAWSDSTARALLEFNRALLYLAALVLFGLAIRQRWQLQWLVWGLAAGIVVVCAVAVTTRVLPNVWPVSPNLANERLSYPITYWNALGLLASVGVIFCLQMATRARGPALTRIIGAAAIPLLATTVYFTFSRGAILAGGIGIVAYLVLARPRGALSGLAASVPATAVAVVVAYHADLLATDRPTTAAAVSQGHRVAWVLAACVAGAGVARLALLKVDSRLARPRRLVAPRTALAAAAGTLAVAVAVALALGAPDWASRQYDRFTSDAPVTEGAPANGATDLRQRLTSASSNGRLDYWGIAIDEFERSTLEGQGGGTFQIAWERQRNIPGTVVDAHGLYPETLGELGLVGLILLATALLTILVGIAARIRGGSRTLYAALFAAGLAWALAAAVDWHWEMPVVTLWLFAAGGAAIAARAGRPSRFAAPAIPVRLAVAVPLVLLAVLPFQILSSQAWLDRADDAFARGDCAAASDDARSSISALGSRPEPYELLGYCAIRDGRPRRAIDDMQEAIDRDPENWNFRYGLALARAAAGLDPRPEVRQARDMNPLEPLVQDAEKRFATDRPRLWERRAREVARRLTSL